MARTERILKRTDTPTHAHSKGDRTDSAGSSPSKIPEQHSPEKAMTRAQQRKKKFSGKYQSTEKKPSSAPASAQAVNIPNIQDKKEVVARVVHPKPGTTLVKKEDKPTHVPNITEEIRKRYEHKLAEFQAPRSVKHPERAEKLRRKRANRKTQRNVARMEKARAQKSAKANPSNNPDFPLNKKDVDSTGKLVFSKIDEPRRKDRTPLPKNPSQALQKLQNHQQKLQRLDSSERDNRKKDEAWARAIQKSKGLTVKDDEKRLQATLKGREREKTRKTKDWEDRKESLKARTDSKQKKRQANLQQRADAKKARNMKRRR